MSKELIIQNNRVNVLVGLSFFVMAFVVGKARASECEIVQFLNNKSQAIQVKRNSCLSNDKVSLGTSFVISSGGRLWLKVNATEETDFQLICQNRGVKAVQVKYYSPFLPWIKPEGVGKCDAWVNNKLSCDEKNGAKNTFICAIAVIKRPEYLQVTTLERTTSVKMRNMGQVNQNMEMKLETKPANIQAVTKAIQSEVNLCRNLYNVNQAVNASWELDTSGRVARLSVENSNLLRAEFLSCIESAVQGFAYPRFSNNVMFVTRF